MEKKEQLYEGKAKKVWATEDPDVVIVDYKDDATAFNGKKKGTIAGKGVVNNKMSNYLMQILETKGSLDWTVSFMCCAGDFCPGSSVFKLKSQCPK